MPPDAVWSKVASALRGELGEGPYNSYVAPSCVKQDAAGTPVLVTPTAYARDWFQRNALRRASELWTRFDPQARHLGLKSRVEFESGRGPGVSDSASMIVIESDTGVIDVAEIEPKRDVRIQGLQDRLTFESFVSGRGNEFALNMARQVATWVDGPFNPVFFHGPYGFGKTHLLNAIAWEAQRLRPSARIVYLTAERFLSSFVKAVMDKSTGAFKDELRSADLLLIDDVHFIGGKPSSQEELFHTLTALVGEGRRVVFSADRPPTALSEVEGRLRSHMAAGLVCALEPADGTLRMGIAERKIDQLSRRLGVTQPPKPEVMQFLAERVPGSIRELEGAINTLVASAGGNLARLGLEDVSSLLQPNLKGSIERRVTVDEIQKLTAEHYALRQADLLSERRTRAVARPRQVAMWLCKQHTTRSYPDIGRRFGGRDHTTVLHAVKKIEELLKSDEQIARDVETLTRKLRG